MTPSASGSRLWRRVRPRRVEDLIAEADRARRLRVDPLANDRLRRQAVNAQAEDRQRGGWFPRRRDWLR